jgi:hypothetical protein
MHTSSGKSRPTRKIIILLGMARLNVSTKLSWICWRQWVFSHNATCSYYRSFSWCIVHVVIKFIITKGFALNLKCRLTVLCLLECIPENIKGYSRIKPIIIVCMATVRPHCHIHLIGFWNCMPCQDTNGNQVFQIRRKKCFKLFKLFAQRSSAMFK